MRRDAMDSLTAHQRRLNENSRSGWELYEHHRHRITALLMSAAPVDRAGELCVLGTGNCNDIDLQALLEKFGAIHLVDLDRDAMIAGQRMQEVSDHPRIVLHGDRDVTGVFPELSRLTPESDDTQVRQLAARLLEAPECPELPRCDVVASVGLLTQLVESVLRTVGQPHAAMLDLVQAVRTQHLRLLFALARPGGAVVLTSEVVSTDTAPEVGTVPDNELPGLLGKLLAQQNFYTGLHPGILRQTFHDDPVIRSQLAGPPLTPPPWRWRFFTRTYAVCAFVAQKKMAEL